jgi:PKD repeat protein
MAETYSVIHYIHPPRPELDWCQFYTERYILDYPSLSYYWADSMCYDPGWVSRSGVYYDDEAPRGNRIGAYRFFGHTAAFESEITGWGEKYSLKGAKIVLNLDRYNTPDDTILEIWKANWGDFTPVAVSPTGDGGADFNSMTTLLNRTSVHLGDTEAYGDPQIYTFEIDPSLITGAESEDIQIIVKKPDDLSATATPETIILRNYNLIYIQADYEDTSVPVTANFDATPTKGSAPLKVTFTDKSTGDITSREWQYKLISDSSWTTFYLDGTSSYTFTEPGSYDVQLTVKGTGDPNTKLINNYITVEPSENLKLMLDYSGNLIDKNGNLPWSESADIKLHAIVLEGEAPSLTPVEGADIYIDSYSYSVGTTDANGAIDFWLPMKEGGQYSLLAKKGSSTSQGTTIDITQGQVFHDPPHTITLSEMDKFALLVATKQVFGISPWDPKQHYDWCSIITTALGFGVPASKTANVLNCIAGLMAYTGAMQDYGYMPQVGDKNDIIEVQYNVAFTDDFGSYRSKDIVHVDLSATGLRLGGEQYWNRHFWCEPFTGDTWLPFKDHIDLLLNLHSPAVINVQFADGTYVGYNSASGEIEGTRLAFISNIGDEPFTLFIPSAPQGGYKINVIGTGSGPYTLSAQSIDQDLIEGPVVSITKSTEVGKIDTFDATLSESGVITIQPENHPPDLINPGDQTTTEGKTLSFHLVATDPESDLLTYTFTPTLPDASISGNTFTWTPGSGTAGIYSVTFKATDTGDLSDEETIKITVNAPIQNTPPVLTNPGDRSVNEGSALQITLAASDKEGGSLTYSFTSTKTLPGASISGNTFIWTPSSGTAGTYLVKFKATDIGSLSDEETITITVNAPVTNIQANLKIIPKTINLGSKGFFLAFVTLPESYKGATIDMKTVSCSGAKAVRMVRPKIFPRIAIFVFKTSD